jgi:hypothetical protein
MAPAATCLGAKVVVATAAGVNRGSIDAVVAARVWVGDAANATAIHLRTPAATYLGAEVGQARATSVNHSSYD